MCSKIKVIYLGRAQSNGNEDERLLCVTPDVFDLRGQLAIPDLIQLPEESIGKTAVFSCSSEILSAS